ncbi:MAG: FIST N-terminal domain-containing protein [Verrucomicrobiota bacterium]
MLEFYSASTRMVNSRNAISECMEAALGSNKDCDLVIVNAAIGHDYQALIDQVRELAPQAHVVGSSCCGIVGREGVSESMKDVAVMAVRGKELAVAHVDGINGRNAYAKAVEMARELQAAQPDINMVCFLASGIDIANDQCIAGFEAVFGPEVTVFGATSSDNMRGVVSYQMAAGQVFEHAAWAVGFADPTLWVDTQATHGFLAVGEPLTVTKAEGTRIIQLDGRPAWQAYTERLGLDFLTATCGDSIPVGALAEALPEALAAEYGNAHILRVVTRRDADGTMHYPTEIQVGTRLWLTVRDEARIFSDMDRMMVQMVARAEGRSPVAVFHADCLARGRFLFNRVMKEELVSRMQFPFSADGEVPPWLGMYGFGEFARLGGANTYHNYTTALYALYRK